jgi:ZIP family zinc transporter
MTSAFLWGALAASSLLIGYLISGRGLSNRTIGMIMGFGGGALVSAIAYELVPESLAHGAAMGVAFALGALAFFAGDWIVDRMGGGDRKDIAGGSQEGGSGAAIFVGTLLDNIPESLVLGMGIALGGSVSVAFLAAVFISNLPEGVAGTLNMEAAGRSRRSVLWMWVALVLVSALSAAFGYAAVHFLPTVDGRLVQAFAAGAMLTMLTDAMMPEAYQHGGKLVGLFTVMGFLTAAVLSVRD